MNQLVEELLGSWRENRGRIETEFLRPAVGYLLDVSSQQLYQQLQPLLWTLTLLYLLIILLLFIIIFQLWRLGRK